MHRFVLYLGVLILILFSSACGSGLFEEDQMEDEGVIPESEQFTYYSGFNEDTFPAYQAMFIIEFEGSEYEWEYQLTTQRDDSFTEYSLNIEGLDTSEHPGSIRMVTDGESSWMIGPGTDNLCFRFPNSMEINFDYFTPDDLIASQLVDAVLKKRGVETIEGQETVHYRARKRSLAGWRNVTLDIWLAAPDTVVHYIAHAKGDDPLFDAGFGKLGFHYVIQEIGPQEIEPITGCEINYPVPEDSYDFTRLPGLVSFESTQDVETLTRFYLEEMPLIEWIMENKIYTQDDFAMVVFQKANVEIVISITSQDDSTFVEIFEE